MNRAALAGKALRGWGGSEEEKRRMEGGGRGNKGGVKV